MATLPRRNNSSPRLSPVRGVRLDSPDHSAADKQAVTVPRAQEFQPWEACMTINDTWAYRPKDQNRKMTDTLIRSLIEVISRGGNFLLDVGPQPDGQIRPEFADRLHRVGEWTRRNAGAVHRERLRAHPGRAGIPDHGARFQCLCLCDGRERP